MNFGLKIKPKKKKEVCVFTISSDGAMTFSTATLRIMTLGITTLRTWTLHNYTQHM